MLAGTFKGGQPLRRFALTLALLLILIAIPVAAQAAPGWIVSCQYSHGNNDDPIVFPRQFGAAHLHEYAGAKTTNANSTPDSLRAGGTTCVVKGDTAAYWLPALYKNGVLLHPQGSGTKNVLFYYREIAPGGGTAQTIPDGLKMIVGDANATSEASNTSIQRGDIIFKCGPGSTTNLKRPPTQCSSGLLVVSLRFPNCWDGFRLDSPDHKSHMAYPSGGRCPSTHPVNIPRIESFWRYNVGTAPFTITFSSGPYYTVHQDFFNAWDPVALKKLVDRCMGGNINCGTNPVP